MALTGTQQVSHFDAYTSKWEMPHGCRSWAGNYCKHNVLLSHLTIRLW